MEQNVQKPQQNTVVVLVQIIDYALLLVRRDLSCWFVACPSLVRDYLAALAYGRWNLSGV